MSDSESEHEDLSDESLSEESDIDESLPEENLPEENLPEVKETSIPPMRKMVPFWTRSNLAIDEFKREEAYYSKMIAEEKRKLMASLDRQKESFGPYRACQTEILNTVYLGPNFEAIKSLQFSKNGVYLAQGFASGAIQIYNFHTHRIERVPNNFSKELITNFRFNPLDSNVFYASKITGKVNIFKKEESKWKNAYTITEDMNEIEALDITSTGEKLVTAGRDATIRIYDIENGPNICTKFESCSSSLFESNSSGHALRVFSAKFSPDEPNVLVTGGWDDCLKVWDLRVAESCLTIAGPHLYGDAIDVMGTTILTGEFKNVNAVELWDMSSCKLLETVEPVNRATGFYGEFIYCARFLRDLGEYGLSGMPEGDLLVVGGSGLGGLEIISRSQNLVLTFIPEPKPIVALDTLGTYLTCGGSGNVLYLAQFIPFLPEKRVETRKKQAAR